MVTFEKVDPLFVLDLSDIDNPKFLVSLNTRIQQLFAPG